MRANQGFYKFKKDIKRIAYDTQAVTGKVVDLRNNVDGYAVVGSTEGDMIKSVGKNLADVKTMDYTASKYELTCFVDDDDIIYINANKLWIANGALSDILKISIKRAGTYRFVLEYIDGTFEKVDTGQSTPGIEFVVKDKDGNSLYSTFSFAFTKGPGIKTIEYVVTEEKIENGASYIRLRVWSNGTLGGGTVVNGLKLRIMCYYVDENTTINDEFEPYKEDRKVCNQNDRCYINTFANGSVYSENDRTITVNFPKSMFASAYRAIANRVNNMDGDDYEEKTVNFFGDSITAGTNTTEAYHMWLSRYTGFHCKNWGVGGSGYIQELTGSFHTGDGIEGIAELKPQTGKNKILTIMKSVGELGNCMIFAGTNDWAAAYDIDAFRTAVQNTLDYAWEHSDRLLVLTPIKRYRGEVKNSAGKRLHEFSGVVIEECIKRGIPYIDGYEMPFDSNNDISALKYYAKEGVDKVHINEAGHKLMAGYLLDRFKAVFK